jgi:hypothetical protein
VKRKELSPDGKLPLVLPLVLYRGKGPWNAAIDVADLVLRAPDGLKPFQLQNRYLLIDQNRYDTASLRVRTNFSALLFQLERLRLPEELREVLVSLKGWWAEDAHAPLKRSITRWFLRLLRRKMDPVNVPEIADLLEMESMLSETIDTWVEQWKCKGLEEGLEKGLEKGRTQGQLGLLCRLLERRFGALPEWVPIRLAAATEPDLLRWADELLEAESLQELFEG